MAIKAILLKDMLDNATLDKSEFDAIGNVKTPNSLEGYLRPSLCESLSFLPFLPPSSKHPVSVIETPQAPVQCHHS